MKINDVVFKNTRFNPELAAFESFATTISDYYGYTGEELTIDNKIGQLLRLRVAQKNTCSYCLVLHTQASRDMEIPIAKIDALAAWWNSEIFSHKEKVSLAYCDALTEGNSTNFQQHHDALEPYYSEAQIAELAAIIINMNIWTRLKLAQGQTPVFDQ